ncbi:hypothetical protein F4775DRAFT_551283 [Biscogniauxia sp. FL1348]|nr:hypothetical protein F4775DRAFT_551283 [Biscogniauxia sp. FL1348]
MVLDFVNAFLFSFLFFPRVSSVRAFFRGESWTRHVLRHARTVVSETRSTPLAPSPRWVVWHIGAVSLRPMRYTKR